MKSMTGMSYSVGSPTRRCARSGRVIETGEEFVAALVQSGETGELSRMDFCAQECAGSAAGDFPGDGLGGGRLRPPAIEQPWMMLGYWRSRMPSADAKPRMLLDDSSLMDLFEQTVEAQSVEATPEREAFVFVLALILARKRLLVVEKTDRQTMTVRPRTTKSSGMPEAASVVLRDPHMTDEMIGAVAGQLEAVLSDEFADRDRVAGNPAASSVPGEGAVRAGV